MDSIYIALSIISIYYQVILDMVKSNSQMTST